MFTAHWNRDLHSGEKWTAVGLILQNRWKQKKIKTKQSVRKRRKKGLTSWKPSACWDRSYEESYKEEQLRFSAERRHVCVELIKGQKHQKYTNPSLFQKHKHEQKTQCKYCIHWVPHERTNLPKQFFFFTGWICGFLWALLRKMWCHIHLCAKSGFSNISEIRLDIKFWVLTLLYRLTK